MLITFVQSVIGTHNKDFSPFNQRGRKKPSDRAENHLLEKSRLHVDLSSTPSAIVGCRCFPSNPLHLLFHFALHHAEQE
jgi:hypothetical protein